LTNKTDNIMLSSGTTSFTLTDKAICDYTPFS
jgi:hypothetical protein